MKKLLGLACILLIAGCASGTVSEGACDQKSVSWTIPNLPTIDTHDVNGSYIIPAVSKTIGFDVSNDLSKISDVASSIGISFNTLTLDNSNGEFDWVESVEVDMQSGTLPILPLALYTNSGANETIDMLPYIVAAPSDILTYLQSGPVQLVITLGSVNGTKVNIGTVQLLQGLHGTIGTTVKACVSVNANVKESV